MERKNKMELGCHYIQDMQTVKIEPTGKGGHKLYIDGNEIKRVRSFRLEMGVDRITTLDLQMMAGPVDAEVREQNPLEEQP